MSPSEIAKQELQKFWTRFRRPCACEPVELRQERNRLECVWCGRKLEHLTTCPVVAQSWHGTPTTPTE